MTPRAPPGDRRTADMEFRHHLQDHLDKFDRELAQLRELLNAYHGENRRRLEHLEAAAKKAEQIVRDWNGEGDDPEHGMRRQLRQLIDERHTIGLGWKVLVALGTLATTIIAAFTVFHQIPPR